MFSHAAPDYAAYPGAGNWADPRINQGRHPQFVVKPAAKPSPAPVPALAQSPIAAPVGGITMGGGMTGGGGGGSPLGGESLFGGAGQSKAADSPLGRLGESSQIQEEEMRRLYELIVAANQRSGAHMDTERPYIGGQAPQGSIEDSSGLYGARNIRGIG